MNGRRRYDTTPLEFEPGDYGLRGLRYHGDEFDAWWVCTPNGLVGRLSMPADVAAGRVTSCHEVEEHDDGTITVEPRPGNSNSILVSGWPFGEVRAPGEPLKSWHGYIDRGVWREV